MTACEKPTGGTQPRALATKAAAKRGGGGGWGLRRAPVGPERVPAGPEDRAGSAPEKEKRPLRGVGPGMLSPAGCEREFSRSCAECQGSDPQAWECA